MNQDILLNDWHQTSVNTSKQLIQINLKLSKIKEELIDFFEDLKNVEDVFSQSNWQRKKSQKLQKTFNQHLEIIKQEILADLWIFYDEGDVKTYESLKKNVFEMAIKKLENHQNNSQFKNQNFEKILLFIGGLVFLLSFRIGEIRLDHINAILYIVLGAILTYSALKLSLSALSLNNQYQRCLSILQTKVRLISDNIEANQNTYQ